jgi:hypothetical protein
MKMSAAFSALGIVLILSVAALGIIAVEPIQSRVMRQNVSYM